MVNLAAVATRALMVAALGGLISCRGPQTPPPTVPSPDSEAPNVIPSPEGAEPAPPAEDPAASEPKAVPDTVTSSAQLPQGLVGTWDPASNVLYEFGQMTITAEEIQWDGGQSSPYTVVSEADGYLLELESAPSFYDVAHPYIKLMPEINEDGTVADVEVAFYENEASAQGGEFIMLGTYF